MLLHPLTWRGMMSTLGWNVQINANLAHGGSGFPGLWTVFAPPGLVFNTPQPNSSTRQLLIDAPTNKLHQSPHTSLHIIILGHNTFALL
jgi:hypothetical protein